MGAQSFDVRAKGKTAQEAFDAATGQARDDHGHGRYTGTIAEKHSFVVIKLPEGKTADEYLQSLKDDYAGENPYNDKWGPAGCVDMGGGEWLFFGSASS